MKKCVVWGAVVGGLLIAGAVIYLFRYSANGLDLHGDVRTGEIDPIATFLAKHWVYPLPPEGAPPAQYSAIEASLAPEACGQCHVEQYRDWRSSLHSRTVGPGLLWQFFLMDQESANGCMRCHAPLAEQKALMALEHGWPHVPSGPRPSYVPANLDHEGLVCAACHVRAHRRFGPPPRTAIPASNPMVHGGFTQSLAFEDSRFCAVCHQFPATGTRLNGKLLENTYNEWLTSDPRRAGKTCQSCHMPDRRHLWRGIHDPKMTTEALSVTLHLAVVDREHMWAEAKITNTGAGHDFPTYVVPEVFFTLQLTDPRGRSEGQIAHTVVARRVNIDLTQEEFDDRIRSGESRTLSGEFRRPAGMGWSVVLRMAVHPGAHYERVFQYALHHTSGLTHESRELLREALRQVTTAHYHVVLARKVIH